jgi:hypothetical protein
MPIDRIFALLNSRGALHFAAIQIQEGPDLLRSARAAYMLPDDENLERLKTAILRTEAAGREIEQISDCESAPSVPITRRP